MKIIISHDVDHLTAWEHNRDLLIPKHVIRNIVEFVSGRIGFSEVMDRSGDIFKNKWQNLESLSEFNSEHNIPSTFFFGVSNGLGLNYTFENAAFWIKEICEKGFDVGVHGIAFQDFANIKKEHDLFKAVSGLDGFGIRMHYLRSNEKTPEMLDRAGYAFDSSLYKLDNPFRIGGLWEFPLHIMDGYVICRQSKWQNQDLNQCKDTAQEILEAAFDRGIQYFTILFHDRYFTDSFRTWKEWYIWLIQYLKNNGFKFVNYRQAIEELEIPIYANATE